MLFPDASLSETALGHLGLRCAFEDAAKAGHLNLKCFLFGGGKGSRQLSLVRLDSNCSGWCLVQFLKDSKGNKCVGPDCTVISGRMAGTISTDRKIQPHRHPRGPAWLLGFGSSPTQIGCCGAAQYVQQFTGGGQSASSAESFKTGAPGRLLSQLQSTSGRTLETVLVEFSSLLSLLCSGTVRHSGSARMNRAYGHNRVRNTEAEENLHGNQTDAKCLPSAGYSRACR